MQGSVFSVNQMETFCATHTSDNSMTTRAGTVSCTFKLRRTNLMLSCKHTDKMLYIDLV